MAASHNTYSIPELIRDLAPYSPKFLINTLLESPFWPQLDKIAVINTLVKEENVDGTPLEEGLKLMALSLMEYEEAIEFQLIPNFFKINFGIDLSDPFPIIILEGKLHQEKTDLKITAQANGSIDLSSFPFLVIMKKVNGRYEPDVDTSLIIPIANQKLIFELNSNLEFTIKTETNLLTINFPPCQIGNSGFIFEVGNLAFNGKFTDFSLAVRYARLIPPEEIKLPGNIPFPEIVFQNGFLSKDGITGSFSTNWELQFDANAQSGVNPFSYVIQGTNFPATLFGSGELAIKGGLSTINIFFEKNILINGFAEGQILIPYFDEPVDIQIKFTSATEFSILFTSISQQGLELSKDELLNIYIKMLGLAHQDGVFTFLLSGELEPLLFASEGMKWPRMDVKNLMIDSTGKFSIDEAWLDLKDMATLDLFGFHLELRKIGLGTLSDSLWIDLSGGLKLIDQIPIGLDIEGFRISWPQNLKIQAPITEASLQELTSQIGIQFKGVQLSFGVPGAIQLDGLIRFFKEDQVTGFAGDMVLVIPPAGITAEAGLMVGMNSLPDPFPFFYVYFGLEAAAGIPLGQSGLALKGALGLFGINVAPNILQQQNWYYDWYKKAPALGAHQTTKWQDEKDALAVGAGLTITTVDGIVKGTKGIIVLALPGPILVINGKALILDGLNPDPNAEPPFSATAIFDGKDKIVQFNIEAQAEIVEDMVDAYAGVEAFFDFKDITNWHLYLGQDQPKDRRIRANVLNVVEADAYLMLDMLDANSPRTRMGIDVSVKPKIDDVCFEHPFGEECIQFNAHLDLGGSGEVSVQPEQFSGDAHIDAGIVISGLGLELEVGANANLSVEGPSPFSLEADLVISADLPSPLPDYEDTFHYKLTIPEVDLKVNDPLVSVSLFSRFTSESKRLNVEDALKRDDLTYLNDTEKTIVGECDVNPILSFEHEMNQGFEDGTNQDYKFIMHPGGTKTFDVGAIRFTPTLKKVVISEKKKNDNSVWDIVYSTEVSKNKPIIGAWIAESDPSSPSAPASRRLQLMTTNPLTNTMHYTGMMGYLMMQTEAENIHLSEQILEDYPDLMTCAEAAISPICVNFMLLKQSLAERQIKWANLTFESSHEIIINDSCLGFYPDLKVSFPESAVSVEIEFCKRIDKVEILTFAKPKGDALAQILREALKYHKKPNTSCSTTIERNIEKSSDKIKVTVNDKSFDCLQISSKSQERIEIKSICYITEKAKDGYAVNQKICDYNKINIFPSHLQIPSDGSFVDNNIFKPGCYYEIEVLTQLEGEILNIGNSDEDEGIENAYLAALGPHERLKTKYIYFQTDAPPQNLEPYIKWSLPKHQGSIVFVKDPIHIRFKRGYINSLFGTNVLPSYRLKVYLRDTTSTMPSVPNGKLNWLSADSSTLFPDEETWQKHLSANQIQSLFKKDDIVSIDLSEVSYYKPNSRYELLLVGTRREDITDENDKKANVIKIGNEYFNILSSRTFTTSKFGSFGQLMRSGDISDTTFPGSEVIKISPIILAGGEASFDGSFSGKVDSFVTASMNYYKTLVDYEYGIAKALQGQANLVSKEAVECRKLEVRKFKDQIDEEFRQIARAINQDVLFNNTEGKLTIYAIKNTHNKIEFIWIKLPEMLSLKMGTVSLGRLDCQVYYKSIEIKSKIFNSDTTQIIVKLRKSINIKDINYLKIAASLIKDFGDDSSVQNTSTISDNNHHRFDRPSLRGIGREKIEITPI